MRDIKFRAWNIIDKAMVDNTSTLTNLRGFIKSKHYHPMQYIGLKDKNGVETYKKDIVKYMENVVDGHFVEVVVVVDFDFTGVNFNYATEFEVIGNIYENPELIK